MNLPEPSTDPPATSSQAQSTADVSAIDGPTAVQSSTGESMLQSKWMVLAILFVATGALGIPLLWANKRFSTAERWFWALLMTAYSLSLLIFFGWFVFWLKAQVLG